MKYFLYFFCCFLSFIADAQVSLQNPFICHDNNGYLRTYYDSTYLIKFKEGKFEGFSSADSMIQFSDSSRIIVFVHKSLVVKYWYDSITNNLGDSGDKVTNSRSRYRFEETWVLDTVSIRILKNSIILRKKDSVVVLTSMKKLPNSIGYFHISTSMKGEYLEGFVFYSGSKECKLDILESSRNKWSWKFTIYNDSC